MHHYKEVKGILSQHNGTNFYRGCTHGCIYCDSRSKCYDFKHDFEDIEVKINAPQLLEAALKSKRKKCMISTGAMCDPYLHLEKEERLTRKCFEIIEKYGFGLSVLTKSDLILRDTDLLESINKKAKCVVEMTLTTADENLCKIIEPNVATTYERYKALKEMQKRGIPTIVWLCPILPYINDTEENVRKIVEYCADAGVRGIICFSMGMTLREGNREYYYAKLEKHFKGLKEQYIKEFGNSYIVTSKHNARLMNLFYRLCEKYGIVSNVDENFNYLHTLDIEPEQISLF